MVRFGFSLALIRWIFGLICLWMLRERLAGAWNGIDTKQSLAKLAGGKLLHGGCVLEGERASE